MDAHDELVAAMAAAGLGGAVMPTLANEIDVPEERELVDDAALESLFSEVTAGAIVDAGPQDATALIEAAEQAEADAFAMEAMENEGGVTVSGADADEADVPKAVPVETVEDIDGDIAEALVALERREEVYGVELPEGAIPLLSDPVLAAPPVITAVEPASPKGIGLIKRVARFAPGGAGGYVAGLLGDSDLESRVDGLPKKVKEKAANLADHLKRGSTLSVFTQAAVNIMQAEGAISNERLVRAFTTEATKRGMTAGYSIGTARSQAGQQVSLFTKLGIGRVSEAKIVPNVDSPIWQALSGTPAQG